MQERRAVTRESRHVCATIRSAVRWVVYFQPTPAHERQAGAETEAVVTVMETGCGQNRP